MILDPYDQLSLVGHLAEDMPHLRIVVDHFGWPTDLSDEGRETHLGRLAQLAARPNVATRLDAAGTIFGPWHTEELRSEREHLFGGTAQRWYGAEG